MHIRKLVKAGQTSHTVSLPKEWLEKNQLRKGSAVYIHELSGHELRITPKPDEHPAGQKHVIISIDNKRLDTIQREITAAYVNNAGTIELAGKELAKNANELRKMLHDFVALEISEQTATRMLAKDLLNLNEISVEKSISRMDIITRTMLKDCIATAQGKDLSQSVLLRDYDVNRLYFLLARLLKSAMNTPLMAARLGLNPAALLQNWMLVHHLEQVADAAKSLCRACARLKGRMREMAAEAAESLEHDYCDVMKAMHSHDKALADSVARKQQERQGAAARLHNEAEETTHHCTTLSSIITDIARLVIDEQN